MLEACDGQDGLSKLKGQRIHLMICDVNMPNMDGITFLKAVRGLPDYKFTPIIMLTTEAGEEKKREGQTAGARASMVKPFKPDQGEAIKLGGAERVASLQEIPGLIAT